MSKLLWGPGYSMLTSLWQLLVPYACTKSAINTCAFSSSSLGQAGFFSWIESALVYKFLSYIVPFSGSETEGRCSSAWYDFILSKYLIVARKIKVGCCTTQAVWYHSIIFVFFSWCAAGIVIEQKNWPPFFPIIHHDIANEIPIHLQRLQYTAFATWLGMFFDSVPWIIIILGYYFLEWWILFGCFLGAENMLIYLPRHMFAGHANNLYTPSFRKWGKSVMQK